MILYNHEIPRLTRCRVILHRPYLRFDPKAYPESQEIVVNAANTILTAYETAFQTKASVFWVWWSIPYRVSLIPTGIQHLSLPVWKMLTRVNRHSTLEPFVHSSLFENLVPKWVESAWYVCIRARWSSDRGEIIG